MRVLYFDCFSGAAGDMILGALIAAGADRNVLQTKIAGLPVDGFELKIEDIRKQGFAAIRLSVDWLPDQTHRHLHHIRKIIDASSLSDGVKRTANQVFTRLAEAEARVHGTTIEKVHFHEVGAIDAIVDVVGTAIALELLNVDRVVCSPLPVGSGTVKCDHGIMPVPAPATAELLKGVPIAACDETGELLTPTGAAILTTIADAFGPMPEMRIESIGFGAGTREGKSRPNVLRALVGEAAASLAVGRDEVVVLETNLDDCTGEEIGRVIERLLELGALDAFCQAIVMKKGRPGVMLTAIAPPEREAICTRTMLRETTTFGVRRRVSLRATLERRIESVETAYGLIRVKLGLEEDRVIRVAPEYDDCDRAARTHGVALRDVMDAARKAWTPDTGNGR
ncbi:MAG: nickel pincer cofactor biosynthesis protein LarC [Phycisphaerales bacterium]|nr:nickel pincer cofactor biosynthesis protein LarC [Phycisphaerales bacterium]MCB9864645.1 nickel pincer cofactor biosynthesis protein LarC [Phycisphaerales bacterium]